MDLLPNWVEFEPTFEANKKFEWIGALWVPLIEFSQGDSGW